MFIIHSLPAAWVLLAEEEATTIAEVSYEMHLFVHTV